MQISARPSTLKSTETTSLLRKKKKPKNQIPLTNTGIHCKKPWTSQRKIQHRVIKNKQTYRKQCIKYTIKRFCQFAKVIIDEHKQNHELTSLTAETMTRQFCQLCRIESRNHVKAINKVMDIININDASFMINTENIKQWIQKSRFDRLTNITDVRAVFFKRKAHVTRQTASPNDSEQHANQGDKQQGSLTGSPRPSTSHRVSRPKAPSRPHTKHVQCHRNTERDKVRDTLIKEAISALQNQEKSAGDVAATLQRDHSDRWKNPNSLHISLKRWILDNRRAQSFGFSQVEIDNAQSKYK